MSSRDQMEQRRRSFDSFAAHYDKVRPSYPQAAVNEIEAFCGLTRESRVLEIGTGTGQATRLFAHRDICLTTVEPSPSLASLARANLAQFQKVSVLEQTFEDAALPEKEYDLIFAAQSFHWVDSPAGFEKAHRLLHGSGTLAVFWNLKRPLSSPLQQTFEELYRLYFQAEPWFCMSHACLERSRRDRRKGIESSALFRLACFHDYPWSRRYTSEEYLELVDSYTDHRLLPNNRKRRLYDGIAAAIEAHGGILDIHYTTVLFLCVPIPAAIRRGE